MVKRVTDEINHMITPQPTSSSASVLALLEQCHLNGSDLDNGVQLLAHYSGQDCLAVVGLEPYENVGLLRSLAIAPEHRGQGWAQLLVKSIEQQAINQNIAKLYLLTETASEFFNRLGYQTIERAQAPDMIRQTSQFNALCPSSAVLMYKSLAE